MAQVCELPEMYGHAAASFKNFIIVFGGFHSRSLRNVIWIYNLFTEQWSKQVLPDEQLSPPRTENSCAVTIEEEIYMFGGYDLVKNSHTNALWKLTITPAGLFIWSNIGAKSQKKIPSPRDCHSGWEYAGKLWTFGGRGSTGGSYDPTNFHDIITNGYLGSEGDFYGSCVSNNQLLRFDPSEQEWTNLRSSGTIPGHRYDPATAPIGEKLWLFGGNRAGRLDDLYHLNMPTLIWTVIRTAKTPRILFKCSLTAVTDNQLLLYASYCSDTWILDTSSLVWRQYAIGWNEAFHTSHTATKGMNSSVAIIGGASFPSDKNAELQHYKVISIPPEPKSLQHTSMKIISQYRDSLPWNILPKVLIAQIMFPGVGEDHHHE